MDFDLDEHNLFHIAIHGVICEQVEEAMRSRSLFLKRETRNGEERHTFLGRSNDGRILFVAVTQRKDLTRCVTAFPAGKAWRRIYEEKIGGSFYE